MACGCPQPLRFPRLSSTLLWRAAVAAAQAEVVLAESSRAPWLHRVQPRSPLRSAPAAPTARVALEPLWSRLQGAILHSMLQTQLSHMEAALEAPTTLRGRQVMVDLVEAEAMTSLP